MKLAAALMLACAGWSVEHLQLDVVEYEAFMHGGAVEQVRQALFEKGIVGIRNVPGYREHVERFIAAARAFSSLSDEEKELYAPNRERGDLFLGFEKGKEKFKRPDGQWVVDDLKNSYYAFVPNCPLNIWPKEIDLSTPYTEMGVLMSSMGKAVMKALGLLDSIELGDTPQVGRMLYYQKSGSTEEDNPYWCGAHFDHGMFTVLLPAYYYENGEPVPEPEEAGLFVRTDSNAEYRKVAASDPDVMMFQVGEFGQLISNDRIRATEHRVHKPSRFLERYTMALFFDAPMETVIHSTSTLTHDSRYGTGGPGSSCTYQQWHEASFARYIVK